MLHDAVELGLRAASAARTERGRAHPANALFDWTAMRIEVLDDVTAFGTVGATALQTDGMQAIPRLSPALSIDVGSFLTTPFDGTSEGPVWIVENDSFGPYVRTNGDVFERLLAPHFDTNPFADGAPSRSFAIDWSDRTGARWLDFFDPDERWSMAYACD